MHILNKFKTVKVIAVTFLKVLFLFKKKKIDSIYVLLNKVEIEKF